MRFKYKYIKNWNRTFSVFEHFDSLKQVHPLVLSLFADRNDRFPYYTLSHTSTQEISTLSYNWTEPSRIGQYSEYSDT